MSDELRNLVEQAMSSTVNSKEVDSIEMRRVSKFSYGVFNPDDEDK